MRRCYHVRQGQHRIVPTNGLFPKDIQACSSEATIAKSGVERPAFYQSSSGRIHQVRTIAQRRQYSTVDKAARLLIQPDAQHQNFGLTKACGILHLARRLRRYVNQHVRTQIQGFYGHFRNQAVHFLRKCLISSLIQYVRQARARTEADVTRDISAYD